jgi:hypothetical protein
MRSCKSHSLYRRSDGMRGAWPWMHEMWPSLDMTR